jgi:pimeloyl-ACP methyl ester carboxylesterase
MRATKKTCNDSSVRIEYLLWPAKEPTLPAALLVPGMASAAASWLDAPGFVDALSEKGARSVVAVSLRGRGGSECPETGWTPEAHHADLTAVIAAEGIAPCHVIGHSVGGSYAIGLALERPDLVASLVVGDYPPWLRRPGPDWVRHVESMSGELDKRFPARIAAESRDVSYGDLLPTLDIPILVLQGTEDGALLNDRDLRRFSGARRLEVVKVRSGHDVFSPKEAQRACIDFLRRADAAPIE